MYIILKSALTMLRKKVSQNVLIGIIIMMISTLLYIGISIVSQTAPFQEMYHRANAGENMIVMTKINDDIQRTIDWYANRSEVEQVIAYETDMVNIEYEIDDKYISELIFLTQYYENSEVDVLYTDSKTIADAPKGDQIIVSHSFAKNRDLVIGDVIKYKYKEKEFDLIISSIVVDPQFSTVFMSPYRCFIDPNFFKTNNMDNTMQILSIKYHDIENIDDNALFAEFSQSQTDISGPIFIDYKSIENSYNIIMGIIAAILIAVSILIFVIVVFVIKSTIQNQILNQYKEIGVKKAIGYTNNQIRYSMIFVYGLIGTIASVIGVIIGLPIRGLVNAGITSDIQVGVETTADIFMLITVLLVLVLIITFSWRATGKAAAVKPVQAIKYGMPERKYENNKFSIVSSKKIPLSLLLAIKQAFANKRKTATTILLIALLAYVAILIGNMGYTFASSKYLVSYLFGMRVGDASISISQGENVDEAISKILSLEEVQECVAFSAKLGSSYVSLDGTRQQIGRTIIYGYAPDDFVKIKHGRQPNNDHEIVISSEVANGSGKTTGDYITIKVDEDENSYLISGVFDSISNNMSSYLQFVENIPDSMLSDNEYFWIYTKTGEVDIEQLDKKAKRQVGLNTKVTKFDSNVKNVVSSVEAFPMVINLLLVIFLIVSGIIIFNATIININNSTKVYGILKAIGFSNSFIVRVLLIKALLMSIIGVILGTILSILTMNIVMDAVFAITPFSSISMPVIINSTKSILLGILFLIVSVVSTLVPSRKISKVSPKQLISE